MALVEAHRTDGQTEAGHTPPSSDQYIRWRKRCSTWKKKTTRQPRNAGGSVSSFGGRIRNKEGVGASQDGRSFAAALLRRFSGRDVSRLHITAEQQLRKEETNTA